MYQLHYLAVICMANATDQKLELLIIVSTRHGDGVPSCCGGQGRPGWRDSL